LFCHGCGVVPEKSVQDHWLHLADSSSPLPELLQIHYKGNNLHLSQECERVEGDGDMQEYKYSGIKGALGVTIHDYL
jgi:hypothetical protein